MTKPEIQNIVSALEKSLEADENKRFILTRMQIKDIIAALNETIDAIPMEIPIWRPGA